MNRDIVEVVEFKPDRVWRVVLNGFEIGSIARDRTAFGMNRLVTRGAFACFSPDVREVYFDSVEEATSALVRAWWAVWVGMQKLRVEPVRPPNPTLSKVPRKPRVPKVA